MRINGQFKFLGLLAFALIYSAFAAPASAQEDRAWSVESQAGTVWVQQDAMQPVALNSEQSLRAGSTIETGDDGRVVLVRGDESIIISPRTSIALPTRTDSGMATTILQSFGTILLHVEKRARQHFEVETPFLAAVVKGTRFTVTVDQSGAAVHVVEGAVEVTDLDTGDIGMVRPGQTAHTPAAQGVGLSVGGPGAATPTRAAVPAQPNKVVPAPARQQASAPRGPVAPIILAAVGRVSLDVGTTTNGLARAASVSNGNGGARNVDDTSSNDSATGSAAVNASLPPGLVGNDRSNAGGNGVGAGSDNSSAGGNGNGIGGGSTNSNAGGNGNGIGGGSANSNAGGNSSGLGGGSANSNAGGNSGGLGGGSANSNAGGNSSGLGGGSANSNAGGNGNSNAGGNGNSNAGGNSGNAGGNGGGNGNGNGKV